MVQLAPHLVYPTPFLVPSFAEERRDRKLGIGLNMYDVMATTRVGRSRREMRSSKDGRRGLLLVAGPPPHDRPRRAARDGPLAGAARPQRRLPLLRLPDRRRAAGPDDPRRGRALRRGDAERRRGDRGAHARRAAPSASPRSRPSRASASRSRPRTSSTRPASGPTGSAPEVADGGGRAADQAQPRHPRAARPRRPLDRQRRLHRPGRRGPRRSSPCPGTGARWSAPPTTTTRATSTIPARARPTSSTCSTRSTPSSASSLGDADLVGAYAGVRPLLSTGDPKKSVDISRKAELYETSSGMLTITGGKLTTWRRMAKQTVDRLVEREGREAPCHTAEIPLGMRGAAGGPGGAGGGGGGGDRPARLPLRPRGARRAASSPARSRSWPRRSSPAAPTCSPRWRSRRGSSRRAASPTCCCAAPGSACWRRRSCAAPTPSARSPQVLGDELGWSRRQVKREAEAWPAAVAEAGIDPPRRRRVVDGPVE